MRAGSRRRRRPERGLTLAEALVSIVIMALMGSLMFGAFSRALDSRTRAEAVSRRYHQLRQAQSRMARELSAAFLSQHRDCNDPRTFTLFLAKRAQTGSRLDFNSFSHLRSRADANESDQNEIGYFLAADPKVASRQHLMRREKKRIDERKGEGGVSEVLVEDVTDLSFSFYNPKSDQWQDDWDDLSTDTYGRLPKFAAVTVRYREGEQERSLVVKTRLFLQAALSASGVGFSPCPL